ncbi:MAG: (Fe-S)-binding protein [Vampirovibrionales bacterium]|nr:(Fe-S)-binding protein [Vampirovibrionales bacterium]
MTSGCNTPLLDKSFDQLLDACIHCGFCLPACPTYRLTGSEAESPRGRIYLMRQWHEGTLTADEVNPAIDTCLGCMACTTACPSGVDYGGLLAQTRPTLLETRTKTPGERLARVLRRFAVAQVLPNPSLLKLAAAGLRLTQALRLDALFLALPFAEGLSALIQTKLGGPHLAQWLRMAPQLSLLERNSRTNPIQHLNQPCYEPELAGATPNGQTVALFLGCVMQAMFEAIHLDTVFVLLKQGYRVTIPQGQTCCGALAEHAGEPALAEPLLSQNANALLAQNPDFIVLNAAGCSAFLKHAANPLASRVIDIMALLARRPLAKFSQAQPAQVVTYHAACHLHHAQKVVQEPLEMLAQVPGVTLKPLKDATMCCGSAGVYNLQHPDYANAILDEKTRHVLATKADCVVTGNPGCLLQIQAGLRQAKSDMRACHPVSLLAEAYAKSG